MKKTIVSRASKRKRLELQTSPDNTTISSQGTLVEEGYENFSQGASEEPQRNGDKKRDHGDNNTNYGIITLEDLLNDDEGAFTLPITENLNAGNGSSPSRLSNGENSTIRDLEVLIDIDSVLPRLEADCAPVRGLEIDCNFDLRPLVRAAANGASAVQHSAVPGDKSDEAIRRWLAEASLYCYPQESVPVDNPDILTSGNSVSAVGGTSAGCAGKQWVESLQDAWRRLNSPTSCASTLDKLYLLSPRCTAAASSTEFEKVINCLIRAADGNKAPVRCVLTGVNTPLLVRLQHLGASPRIVTMPGAVLPGVYSDPSFDQAGTSKQKGLHQQQQRQKAIAKETADKQAQAVGAVAAFGFTVLVVGAAEVGITVDLLCQIAFDGDVSQGSSAGTLQLATTRQAFISSRRESNVLPIIASERPFLHAHRAPIHIVGAQQSISHSDHWELKMSSVIIPKTVSILMDSLRFLAEKDGVEKVKRNEVGFLDARVYQRAVNIRRRAGAGGRNSSTPVASEHTRGPIQFFSDSQEDEDVAQGNGENIDVDNGRHSPHPLYSSNIDDRSKYRNLHERATLENLYEKAANFSVKLVRPRNGEAGDLAMHLVNLPKLETLSELRKPGSEVAIPPQLGVIPPPVTRTIDVLVWHSSQPEDVEASTRLSPQLELHPTTMLARAVAENALNMSVATKIMEGVTVDRVPTADPPKSTSVLGLDSGFAYDYSNEQSMQMHGNYDYGDRAGPKPSLESVLILDGPTKMTV